MDAFRKIVMIWKRQLLEDIGSYFHQAVWKSILTIGENALVEMKTNMIKPVHYLCTTSSIKIFRRFISLIGINIHFEIVIPIVNCRKMSGKIYGGNVSLFAKERDQNGSSIYHKRFSITPVRNKR